MNTLNFSIAQDLTQMVDFITRIPDRRDQLPATLDLFLSSDPSICNFSSSSPLGSSDHVLISIKVSLNSACVKDPPIHRTLFSYENCGWDAFRDFLRDVPWDNVFELAVDNCAYEVSSWIQAGIDAFVPSRKYQVKPHSSPWFSPACAAVISHRNHYFHLYRRDPSNNNKRLFTTARNHCKRVLSNAKLEYAQMIQNRVASQKVGSRDFWRICNSILNFSKSSIPPIFNGPEVLTSPSDKAELFAKLFSANSTLDDSGAVLPDFPARTDILLENMRITPSIVASIISKLDAAKAT